jgi:hypothetical protein
LFEQHALGILIPVLLAHSEQFVSKGLAELTWAIPSARVPDWENLRLAQRSGTARAGYGEMQAHEAY